MRLFLLASAVLLPLIGRAQLFGGGGFEEGSYVLNASPTVRQSGQLKLRSSTQLNVQAADGKTLKLKPQEVYCFRIRRSKYITASNFHVKGGLDVGLAFVEQLDSGRVILMRYTYSLGSGMMMGAGGTMTGGGSSDMSAYLLCDSGPGTPITVAQAGMYSSNTKGFRAAVRPYLATRPDLQKLLDDKLIDDVNLPTAIHALNNNLPFR